MTTTTRPLPYDLPTLRQHWLPPEPTGTTVTANRNAQQAIWAAVTAATAELDRHVTDERTAVAALVEAAIDGADITKPASDLGRRSPVPSLRHHLDLLQQASTTIGNRLNAATLADPAYLAWQAECREIEDEWQRAINESDDRTGALLAFAERHHPS